MLAETTRQVILRIEADAKAFDQQALVVDRLKTVAEALNGGSYEAF